MCAFDDSSTPRHGHHFSVSLQGATAGEFYVTVWLNFPIAGYGRKNPRTPMEKLHKLLGLAAPLIQRGTHLLRCTYAPNQDDTPADCQIAAGPYYMANGVTKRPSDNTIFVNDLLAKRVHVLTRDAAGALHENATIALRYAIDNMEYDSELGEIHAGSLPALYLALAKEQDHSVAVPGGLTVIRKNHTKDSPAEWVADEELLMHDGTKLSQIASAVRFRGVTAMGSPYSRGLLLCRT